MRALILDGASAFRDMAEVVGAALAAELDARGHLVAWRDLTALEIPECKGDFGCWTATPGRCVQPGPHRELARDLIRCDLVVWITEVTFGGYSSALKRLLDHCVPLITPWMTTVSGETHHEPRYERFPDLLVVGLMERPETAATKVFERLVQRNALNMYASRFASLVLTRGELPGLDGWIARSLDGLAASGPPQVLAEPLSLGAEVDLPVLVPRRALLLAGSPRGNASVSAAIVAYAAELLVARGLTVAVEHVVRRPSDRSVRELDASIAEADVVGLATPLYVDSLPAPLTETLELLARARKNSRSRPRFLAMVNCGFPEAVHTDTALAICRLFAQEANLDWIGGLGIGGGGMLAGRPLAELGGRARAITKALELTADALAQGQIVPDEAQRLVRRLPIPRWLYRLLADWGFSREAKRRRGLATMSDRPDLE
jgi:NAD(P)H-dependent FMN reductase